MALPDIKKIPPATLHEFRNADEALILQIPETLENRKCTDIGFLIFFIVSMSVVIIIVGISAGTNTDYNRFLNGYDKCGDSCGAENPPLSKINCSGKDLTHNPFMKFQFTGHKNGTKIVVKNYMLPDTCVNECEPPNRLLFHRCIPDNTMPLDRKANRIITFVELMDDLSSSVLIIIVPMSVVGLLLSLVLFFFFHYSPSMAVGAVLTLSVIFLFAFTGYAWYGFLENTDQKEFMFIGIASTIVIFFLALFICYFYDRYSIVIQMFNEATTATLKVPTLILFPLVTLILLSIFITSMVFLSALISTNEYLEEVEGYPSVHEYLEKQISEVAITYLVLTTIWLFAFVNGCQCIVVAAPVAAHYFQTDKTTIGFPVSKSLYMLVRYHLGTVAFGSLCITIVTVARLTLEFLEDHVRCHFILKCLEYSLLCLEEAVQYLAKRAYIQTAMHGKSLYKSGMRAARLLWANLMDTISIDVVADFIMLCATLLVVLLTIAMGVVIHLSADMQLIYFWSILAIGAGTVGTIVYFFTQIINIAVETIFLCFCEDKLMNDGKARPHFMTDKLKSLVDEAKKAAKKREE